MLKMQHNTRHLLLNVAISECTSDAKLTLGYSLGSIAIPASFVFRGPCRAIKSYNFRTSGHHQGMVVVDNNPVV